MIRNRWPATAVVLASSMYSTLVARAAMMAIPENTVITTLCRREMQGARRRLLFYVGAFAAQGG